jgi:hypothetical protein
VTVIPSMNRSFGRFRPKQVERILSGEEVRDPVGAFLAAMVQDLRDVSRAEVPSSVAARHLLKMRMATEMDEGDPEPLLDVEEPAVPPARPLERRRPAVAALGLAAAMVVMVGLAASITGPPPGGTRSGGILRDVPPQLSPEGPGRFDQFVTNEARSSASSREPGQLPSGGSTGTDGGTSSDQPAGVIDGQGSGQPSGGGTGGGDGSGGGDSGSGEQPQSGGGSGSGGDVVGRGSGSDNRGQKDNAHGKGRGKGGKSRGDGARGSGEKGSSNKGR